MANNQFNGKVYRYEVNVYNKEKDNTSYDEIFDNFDDADYEFCNHSLTLEDYESISLIEFEIDESDIKEKMETEELSREDAIYELVTSGCGNVIKDIEAKKETHAQYVERHERMKEMGIETDDGFEEENDEESESTEEEQENK